MVELGLGWARKGRLYIVIPWPLIISMSTGGRGRMRKFGLVGHHDPLSVFVTRFLFTSGEGESFHVEFHSFANY
jgi:hypothetical protein